MFWQREIIRDGVVMTFNQTYELDLPNVGLLGSLVLYLRSAQNAGALHNVRKWRLFEYISKIEVIGDGAEVIKSFDGRQALAAAFHDQGVEPLGKWGNYSGVTHRQIIPINFGRFLKDKLHGLDLSRFNQVTLKITNDATSTEFSTGITLTVVAFLAREGADAFNGYLREEVWKKWLPVASEINYSGLPTRWPIRRILLQAIPAVTAATVNENLTSIGALMSNIEFTHKGGKTRRFNGSLELLGWMQSSEKGREVVTRGEAMRAAAGHFDTSVGYVTSFIAGASQVTDPGGAVPVTVARADTQKGTQKLWAVESAAPAEWVARGYGYQYCIPLFEAEAPDLSDALRDEELEQTKVDITAGSGTFSDSGRNAENAIILSRLVS